LSEIATLTRAETTKLAKLEAVIDAGMATFVSVGNALTEIREKRLYRESHGTFEGYCEKRFGITPQHGGRLIAAAEVVGILEPMGSIPVNERQARELVPLKDKPGLVTQVWEEIQVETNGKPTAKAVKAAVERQLPRKSNEDDYTYCPTCGHRLRKGEPRPPRRDQ
jgi:hypothetical protein